MLSISARAVAVIWALWVVIDYVIHHPYLSKSIMTMPYAGLLVFLGMLAAGGGYWSYRRLKENEVGHFSLVYRGLWLFLGVQLLAAVVLGTFASVAFMPPGSVATRIGYFFFFSTLCFGGLLLLVITWHTLGQWLTSGYKEWSEGSRKLINIALGASIFGTLLVLIGQFGGITPFVLWPILVGILGLGWRPALDFSQEIIWKRQTTMISRPWTLPLLLLTLSVVAINWLGAFKPFPIGYDGASLYVNLARLTAAAGTLPEGGQAFNWSVMMGAGQALFQQPVFAMLFSHGMNLLVLLVLFRLGRKVMSTDYALLAGSLTLLAPYFAFHGIVDEKTDLAFTFILLSTLLLWIESIDKNWGEKATEKLAMFGGRLSLSPISLTCLLGGWLLGYGFGIKYTAVMFALALVSWLGYRLRGRYGFASLLLGGLGLLFLAGIYRFGYLEIEPLAGRGLGLGLLLMAAAAAFLAYGKEWSAIKLPLRALALVGLGFTLAFLPWGIKHLTEHGSLGINQLLEGKSPAPDIDLQDYRLYGELDQQLRRDYWSDIQEIIPDWVTAVAHPYASFTKLSQAGGEVQLNDSGFREEIQRYVGYEPAFWRYLSLPYDLATNVNIPNSRYLDIGFLALLFFPLLLLGRKPKRWIWSVPIFLVIMLLYVALVQISQAYVEGQGLDLATYSTGLVEMYSSVGSSNPDWLYGIYASFLGVFTSLATSLVPLYELGLNANVFAAIVGMLSVCGLLFFGWRDSLKGSSPLFKSLAAFTFSYGIFWWIMGNGIIWYGMPLFVLLPVVIVYFLAKPEQFLGQENSRFSRYFLGTSVGLSLLFFTSLYFTSPFPTDDANENLFRWPFIEYASNSSFSANKALQTFNPVLPDLERMVNADLDGKVYQVNTFYGYLIEDNLGRVYEDPTLSKYQEITSKLNEPEEFFDVLKSEGFRYILFDLRTASADRTADQSLRQKFGSIARILTNSDKVRLLVTDNIVADPNAPMITLRDGSSGNGRYGLDGQTVQLGNLALFEIP